MPVKKLKIKSAKLKVQAKSQKLAKKIVAKKLVAKKSVKTIKVEAKLPISKPSKAGLTASVFDTEGKVAGHVDLPPEIFNAKINNLLVSQAVRVYLANQRQGTVKTKDRGEVNKTTRKVWQQKGTGRARHGSRRAPIFVGGGVVFGPRPRNFSLSLSKKMKTLALFSAFSSKLKDQELKIVKGLNLIEPKTKIMSGVLKKLGVEDNKRVLLVTPKPDLNLQNVYRAGRNIQNVEISNANMLNAYKVLDNKMIILMKDAIGVLKDTFLKGNKE